MVDYHKKYLKYKQKHLMSKMNTFTGGTNAATKDLSDKITGVLGEAKADNKVKIIDQDGYLTTLTQMKFEEKNICNNKATLIKQVPCLSVKINTNNNGFDLESTNGVVEFTAEDKNIDFTIGSEKYKAKINNRQITNIKVNPDPGNTGPAAGSPPPLVGGEYIITLTNAHLQIAEANMYTGNGLDKCTITFNIVADQTTGQPVPKIDYDTVKLKIT